MASGVSLRQINDWKKEMGDLLRNALSVSREVCGRTGAEATKHMLILMAQSAAHLTPASKGKRKVEPNPFFTHLMRTKQYKQQRIKDADWRHMRRYYQFQARHYNLANGQTHIYGNHPERLGRIGNAGLAKRSWMWGLRDIGYNNSSRPIAGVADTKVLLSDTACGFMLTNRLSYMTKILPAGWLSTVHENASRKVIGQAKLKLQSRFASSVRGMARSEAVSLARAFVGAAT